MTEPDTKQDEMIKEFKDFTPAEKLRISIRYKGWFDSCMKGAPLQSKLFVNAAWVIYNALVKRPQETENDILLIETYAAWHFSCLEGKPMLDTDTVTIARKVRDMLLPDGHNVNPEFG